MVLGYSWAVATNSLEASFQLLLMHVCAVVCTLGAIAVGLLCLLVVAGVEGVVWVLCSWHVSCRWPAARMLWRRASLRSSIRSVSMRP